MAHVPTILADRNLGIQSTGPTASADSFGASSAEGMIRFGQGLDKFAAGAESLSEDLAKIQKHTNDLNNHTWVNESENRLRKFSDNLVEHPDLNDLDNEHTNYASKTDEMVKDYVQNAPSKEAAAMFQARANSVTESYYSHLMHGVIKRKVENSVQTTNANLDSAYTQFNTIVSTDPGKAIQGLSSALDNAFATNAATLAPVGANALAAQNETVLSNTVMRMADKSPDLARSILEKYSTKVDGVTYHHLGTQIDAIENQGRATRAYQLNQEVRDITATIKSGHMPNGDRISAILDEKMWKASLGKDYFPHYDEARKTIQAYTMASARVGAVAGFRPDEQDIALRDQHTDGEVGYETDNIIKSQLAAQRKQFTEDLPGWFRSNNPEGVRLTQAFFASTDDAERKSIVRKMDDTMLQYQGFPGKDVVPGSDDEKRYLKQVDKTLIPKKEAAAYGDSLLQMAPDKAIGLFRSISDRFDGDPAKYAIAMRDIKQANPKISGPWAIISQNINQSWVGWYAGLLQHKKEDSKLDAESQRKIRLAVSNDQDFKDFTSDMIATGRGEDAAALLDGATIMTEALMNGKGKPSDKAAAAMSTKLIFGSTLRTAKYNGDTVVLPKELSNRPLLDSDVERFPENMQTWVSHLDPNAIDMRAHFPRISFLSKELQPDALHAEIKNRTAFRMSNDGESLQLMVHGDQGYPFLLTDHSGKPISIHLSDLADTPNLKRITALEGALGGDSYETQKENEAAFNERFKAFSPTRSNFPMIK